MQTVSAQDSMFPSAVASEQWGVQFDPSPSTSSAASLAAAPGRKRKANFSNDETEALVWNVVRYFGALYGTDTFRAHPVRRKQLWSQIQSHVNFLGYTERSVDDLKHKWRDLRLDVKKKITTKEPPAGTPYGQRLTPLEKMVASTFLQPTHDPEPDIVLDPAGSGPEVQIPETSTMSPPVRNYSLVSYSSEEEEGEGPDGDDGLDLRFSAEENQEFSNQQAMLLDHCNLQGSLTSEPEDTLTQAGGHSEWGHGGCAVQGPQAEEEESRPPNTDLGSFPQGLMGPAWEKRPYENQQGQPPISPLGTGEVSEESPPPLSPCADEVSPSHSLPRGIGGSRPRENRRDPYRATLHRLMEMEDQWDQLYHQELAMWQGEREQQRQEQSRDRDLQLQLLSVLTEIRDELRCLRQERAASRQELASQTCPEFTSPCLCLNPEMPLPKPPSEYVPLFYPGKPESCLAEASFLNGGWGERGIGLRGPQGIFRRGRGRPRGSASRPKRLLMSNR
ncbi:PREDICTED: uncharacterized protein LOC106554355 [Thamnophis sirtalis]|uniref:Uncharacterized protein LOC106554355 n=1 Tax=Thamnophis sirtalis TaxID=35019 RepID=A0A6I9YY14_9SAUR|nr:PREDICTED: uncharacterized protein LOC106554355 [Thamnophis sirtalis]